MVRLYNKDCIEGMRELKENSIDAVITDPPYFLVDKGGSGFMGKEWDSIGNNSHELKENTVNFSMYDFHKSWAKECLRVLKPGGHMLVFGGSRTFHRMTCGIEDAGFEIRDILMWLYSTGMPKGLNISKAIDRKLGFEPIKLSPKNYTSPDFGDEQFVKQGSMMQTHHTAPRIQEYHTAPNSPEAQKWEGWNTSMKPAFEPIIVARKPFKGNIVDNILKHGTGGLNIDECRIPLNEETSEKGRFPTNVILDKPTSKILDKQTKHEYKEHVSRFFYVAKANRKERETGVKELQDGEKIRWNKGGKWTDDTNSAKNNHPTVKPLKLMNYLVKLVCPKDGLVLDPFTGSGSTLVACKQLGWKYIGFEKEKDYCNIAKARLKSVSNLYKWLS